MLAMYMYFNGCVSLIDTKFYCSILFLFISLTGGRTPNYNPGFMTPSHDPSRTPLHGGSAWDPSVSNTPAR